MSGVSGKNSYEYSLARVPKLHDFVVSGRGDDAAVLIERDGRHSGHVGVGDDPVRFADLNRRPGRSLGLGEDESAEREHKHGETFDQSSVSPDMIQSFPPSRVITYST